MTDDRIAWEADGEALYRHGRGQESTESDDGAETAPVAVGTDQGARAARFRDAMLKAEWPNGTKAGRYGVDVLLPAVMAVADAEVAAAVSEARAERASAKMRANRAEHYWQQHEARAESAEAEVERLRRDVAGQTRSAQNGWRTADAMRAEARSAEAELRALREGVRALADKWRWAADTSETAPGLQHAANLPIYVETNRRHAEALRTLLAPSPAATTGEADCGCGETICGECGYCRGSEAHCSALKPPAPVSSGEAGTGEAIVKRAGWDRCKTCGYGGWYGSRWHNPPYGAHYHCDNPEHAAKCQPCEVGDGFHRSSPHEPAEHEACDCPAPVVTPSAEGAK